MNTIAKRLVITAVIVLALIVGTVVSLRPSLELSVPIIVWAVGAMIGGLKSRGRGSQCIVNSGIGGAAGVGLCLFYMVPFQALSNQLFPLFLLVGVGTVAGACLGIVARWCMEGITLSSTASDQKPIVATSKSARRRWYQFSLQKLLFMFAITAIVFGSIGLRSLHLREQSIAVNELRVVGGAFGYRGSWVFDCHLIGPRVRDKHLDHLEGLPHLEFLNLHRSNVTDAGLKKLQSLRNLRVLSLAGTGITDIGLEHLKYVATLRELHLEKTNVTDEGVKRLEQSLPNCGIYH